MKDRHVIYTVVTTICVLAFVCVATIAGCVIFKVPDMNTTLSSGFSHLTDTLIGLLGGLLIQTRSSDQKQADETVNPPPNPPTP